MSLKQEFREWAAKRNYAVSTINQDIYALEQACYEIQDYQCDKKNLLHYTDASSLEAECKRIRECRDYKRVNESSRYNRHLSAGMNKYLLFLEEQDSGEQDSGEQDSRKQDSGEKDSKQQDNRKQLNKVKADNEEDKKEEDKKKVDNKEEDKKEKDNPQGDESDTQSNQNHINQGIHPKERNQQDGYISHPNRIETSQASRTAWYVGALIGGRDHFDEFIKQHIWVNGYEDKYTKLVNSIAEGDLIALKSAYTRKNDLPFKNNGRPVSVMGIKAIGIVKKNMMDGHQVLVDWQVVIPKKEWYFYTNRKAIWKIIRDEGWMQEALFRFTFEGEQQDFNRFLAAPGLEAKYSIYGAGYEWNGFYRPDMDAVTENQKENGKEKGLAKPDTQQKLPDSDIQQLQPVTEPTLPLEPYGRDEFLEEVFLEDTEYDMLKGLLLRKKNLILQGPCGVGKTFMAKRLAYSLLGCKQENHVQMVQFHQNYSYEDFFMGYRPVKDGFELKKGPFYLFCEQASRHLEELFFFIIDEINRGNLSKIFGELLLLTESDKRGEQITLTYQDELFTIPPNIYLIGTMNTADRSLASMDYALKRRFCFFDVEPAFQKKQWKQYLKMQGMPEELLQKIIDRMSRLNREIKKDPDLGEGFLIGHSYFCHYQEEPYWYDGIIKFEIAPVIRDYWFDNREKARELTEELLR